jgi:phage-related protein
MKKKKFIELNQVSNFIKSLSKEVRAEYSIIVEQLETNGKLNMPLGEKVSGKSLFAIRVIQAGNIRVFYVYGHKNNIYGIYGYVKKTKKIPQKELKKVDKIVKLLRQEDLIK